MRYNYFFSKIKERCTNNHKRKVINQEKDIRPKKTKKKINNLNIKKILYSVFTIYSIYLDSRYAKDIY
jgi:hypothetical protein